MVVCDITSFFSSVCGGIKTYYREKARRLPRRGIECHFVVPGPARRAESFGDGILHTIPGPPLIGSAHYRRFGDLRALAEVFGRVRPDVVEVGSHYVLPNLVRLSLARAGCAAAVVGFYHADFPDTYVAPAFRWARRTVQPLARRAAWTLVRRQHARYAATLTGSRHVAAKLTDRGVPGVRWVGLGVDVDCFRPRPPAELPYPLVVYAGRLARDKEIDVLLGAFDGVHRATGARLVIAGDGPLAAEVRAHAAARPYVDALGYLADGRALACLIASADALVAPGSHESFSLAAAEAMACGVPVVGANACGNRELIESSGGGVTFPSGNAAGLAAELVGLLRAPNEIRRRLGARGRDHVVHTLTWDMVFDRIHHVYRDVTRVTQVA